MNAQSVGNFSSEVFCVDMIIRELDCSSHDPPASSSRRDLKRNIAPKLEKLERRTQRAIAEIISACPSIAFVISLT